MRLSPYGSDIGRLGRLVLRPNWSWRAAAAPEDAAFPEDGLLHIAQAIPPSLCDRAVADYERFEAFREQRRCLIRDEQGRNLRVANLHLKSQALLSIGLDRAFHGPAADFFRRDSVLYTSLTFKHGSQQLAHIDTPFFWTRPANLFVGVWIALEDVREQAGPLFYYPGSHRLLADEDRMLHFYRKAQHNVDEMFELMRIEVEKTIRREPVIIKKGDAVIWHPGILHGGAHMAFADTLGAVGTFLNLPPGKRTTTTDSSTKFIGAAAVDTTVTGESVALHRGRTTQVWQTTIRNEAGKLCAQVTQTQLVLG